MKRAIGREQASACENAKPGTRCRCRCGGALHGAARGPVYLLPADDPHRTKRKRRRRKRKRKRKPFEQLELPF